MKAPYILNIPIVHGEITVVTSDHAEATMKHSSRLADTIRKSGVNVLAINCGMSDRRFRSHFYDTHGNESFKEPRCMIKSSVSGNLIGEREAIDQIVHEAKIGVIILSGWEFASSSSRRRTRLLCYLRELMQDDDVAVIIYCHTANSPVAGMVDHGGIGLLSLLAAAVTEIEATEELAQVVKKPIPAVVKGNEIVKPQESAQLVINNIKQLPGVDRGLGSEAIQRVQ